MFERIGLIGKNKYRGVWPWLSILMLMVIFSTKAIVIRHDQEDDKYIQLAKKYSSAVVYLDRCVGTVINNFWVITASHCVSKATPYPVQVTHLNIKYPVVGIHTHPDAKKLDDLDMALLELKWPLKGAEVVQLYRGNDELNKKVTFIGKGKTGDGISGDKAWDKIERAATNTVAKVEPNWLSFTFNNGKHMTELEGVSGEGDSGGPALIETNNGLSIIGVGCCQEPVVTATGAEVQGGYLSTEYYARVSPHYQWITDTMSNRIQYRHYDNETLAALIKGEFEQVEKLLEQDPSWKTDKKFLQELIYVTLYRAPEFMAYLLKNYGFIGDTKLLDLPLIAYAYIFGEHNLVAELIHMGQGIEYKGFRGQGLPSLLTWQYFGDEYQQLIEMLIAKGLDLNAVDERGDSALHMSIFYGDATRVSQLLRLGANVNLADNQGNTALINAVRYGRTDFAKILIEAGADLTHKNKQGETAANMADKMGLQVF